jgi:hypothetical protein
LEHPDNPSGWKNRNALPPQNLSLPAVLAVGLLPTGRRDGRRFAVWLRNAQAFVAAGTGVRIGFHGGRLGHKFFTAAAYHRADGRKKFTARRLAYHENPIRPPPASSSER